MARTVRDAAILLTAMTGIDPDDPAMANAQIRHDYSANLTADGLNGKRIGVIRSYWGAGSNPDVETLYQASIDAMRGAGAEVVDDLTYKAGDLYKARNEVLLYEFRNDLNNYLQNSGAPVTNLAELIAFNEANADKVMPHFGQETFKNAEEKGPLTDETYLAALELSKELSRGIIISLMQEHELDALIAPTNGPSWKIDHVNGDSFGLGSSSLAAVSGYPNITVPMGFVSGPAGWLVFHGKTLE